jgi:hypothetical protein
MLRHVSSGYQERNGHDTAQVSEPGWLHLPGQPDTAQLESDIVIATHGAFDRV